LAPLYAAGQAVIATFDLEEVLTRLVSTVQKHFKLKHIAVLLEDEKTGSLQTRKSIGWSGAGLKALSGGVGLIAAAAEQGRPVYAPDVKKDSRYVATISSTRSEVALPLLANDELVGIVDCQSEKVNFFNASKMQDLKMFAAQAAIGIRNARMFTSKERKAAQLEAINLIARQTTAVLDLSELLDKVCNLVLQAFPVDHAAILLLDESKLVFRAHRGTLTPRFPEGASLSSDEGLCGKSLAMGRPVLENDVSSAFEYIEGFAETRSEVCVPLISFGQSVGVLTLESKKPGAFDENDLASMEAVADICANAIQNARYLEKVRHMAYVDGLTGLFNRRYFENRIEEEIERAKRYQGSMAIIMVDIDHFKRLNDEYGHLLGDDVLRQVSTIFGINLRKADVACRFGGEEFALIVPQTTGDDAFAVADKLRRMIAATTFPGVARPVTVTAGVASFPQNGSTRDELVRAADAALYAGKQSGRNTVISFSSILK
jgi:diguanylate cyclase (GGDEF)-like protein